MSRPEHLLPADVYYGEEETQRYARSSRMHAVQRQLAERALEMLLLPEDEYLNCRVLCTIHRRQEARELENLEAADALLADLGKPFYFRPGTFDGAISISAIQWLCSDIKSDIADAVRTPENTAAAAAAAAAGAAAGAEAAGGSSGGGEEEDMDEDEASDQQLLLLQQQQQQQRQRRPAHAASSYRRQTCFFEHLARALKPGARAALQFYPDSAEQLESLTSAALRSGFEGGLVVDFPNSTRAKKYFLCLWLPGGHARKLQQLPKALGTSAIINEGRERPLVSGRRAKKQISKKEWIAKKKEKQSVKGKKVRPDSKYSGRKRKDKF
ncbi:hypothetical protein, conserved [Eimeria necatrix]|uniref:18S rRNA (guanine(1575)-N(7))-methyltransferase Bud23 C-terminal domain-containing protein n=1 Tax=Eimeria necatrix TaxID=51315 RepID=U6ME32_9EIME|nr:hypothetical protein, conserved [Eimeria necatrix]CDJ62271.1 hypothetical protein, conserved [Eimeria necatrix]